MLVSKELNAAYWSLRIAFGLGPLIAGLDKFTNILVNWDKYLSPMAQQISISPAKNRMTHAMKRSFNWQGRPRKK